MSEHNFRNVGNLVDQLLHVLVGFLITSVSVGGILQGAYVGFAVGVVREHGQMQAVGDTSIGRNRVIDVTAWTLGGMLGGLII